MQRLNPHKFGMALGAFAGLWHLVWSLLVGLGLASGLFNFILKMHFLSMPITFMSFSWTRALVLIIITSIVGYVVGTVFAHILNKVYHRG